jgi:SHAQKYF class myb-like DNA-binding protein
MAASEPGEDGPAQIFGNYLSPSQEAANQSIPSMNSLTELQRDSHGKIIWTANLHERFITILAELQHQAVPSRICSAIDIADLSREAVCQHLKRYRQMQQKRVSQTKNQTLENNIITNNEEDV